MKIHLVSLGCARNLIDSQMMLGHLKRSGAEIVEDPAEAETIIVNTCSFIEPAVEESIDTILELSRLKKQGHCRRLVVAGCLPERYREEIVATLPEVDVFLGTGAFHRIAEAVEGYLDTAKCILPNPDTCAFADAEAPTHQTKPYLSYLKIAEGCSKHCTYCIIPKLRGKQKSRRLGSIVSEAQQLIQNGVKEIVLVAQDTTAYGKDLGDTATLADLLDRLGQMAAEIGTPDGPLDPRLWVRFLYGHPESIDARVMQTVAKHANLCAYFDIPIQHASDRLLKRMGRRYAREDLYRMIEMIRRRVPDAVLRTTVIVGFPGETDGDFNELVDFIKTIRYDHLGCFLYSDAEDLPSHRLSGRVPQPVARKRHNRLMALQANISAENNRRYLGKTLDVLVEERLESGLYSGRTAFQAPEVDGLTYVHAQDLHIGQFATVEITDTLEYDLIGRH